MAYRIDVFQPVTAARTVPEWGSHLALDSLLMPSYEMENNTVTKLGCDCIVYFFRVKSRKKME
jgi:hypothetical protein